MCELSILGDFMQLTKIKCVQEFGKPTVQIIYI